MPKDLSGNIKQFLLYLKAEDKEKKSPLAKCVIIKTKNRKTKFKLRCPRYLYTLKIDDEKKANKIKQSIPGSIKKIEISEHKGKSKKEAKKN